MIGLLRKLFAKQDAAPVPDALWQATLRAAPFLDALDADEKHRLKTLAEQFLATKEMHGAHGLDLDDAARLAIAAQGCLPILNLGLAAYRGWVGVVVYPGEFVVPRQLPDETGVVHEYDDVLSGEAWEGGPLILSWEDINLAEAGYNVLIHEFAHKLDMADGVADGMPPLHAGMSRNDWIEAFEAAYEAFCAALDRGEEGWLDEYAAEHPSEFFAVISEAFFTLPQAVEQDYPAVYRQLAAFYRQDPAAREKRREKTKEEERT